MRKNLKIWRPDLCNISDNAEIGDDVVIHAFVSIYEDVSIGDGTKIQEKVFIPNGVTIGKKCFLGPGVIMTNDKKPPSDHKGWEKTFIEDGVSIGAGCVIMPGITIHKNAMIGAMSLVNKDIPEGEVWFGNPAKFYKKREDL